MRYLNGESLAVSPFFRLRIGRILAVYSDDMPPTPAETTKPLDFSVGRALIEWVDGAGKRDFVSIMFSSFSNPTTSDDPKIGKAYGDISLPSVGDFAVIGFRDPNAAIILGYLPWNYNQQTSEPGAKNPIFGTLRRISPGEFSRTSKQQAEIYQDKAGAVQIIVKAQPVKGDSTVDGSATNNFSDIDPSQVPTETIATVTVGETYTDETFTPRATNPATVNNEAGKIILSIKTTKGASLTMDTFGNLYINSAPGQIIDQRGSIITLNKGNFGAARIGDSTGGHTHSVSFNLTAPSGGGPVTGTITIANATDFIAEGSGSVLIGD